MNTTPLLILESNLHVVTIGAISAQKLDRLLASEELSPSNHLVVSEQRSRLASILERLPEEYRQMIVLRNLQELPYEEIAKRMDRSVGAVRMLRIRALARLRDQIPDLS